MKRVQIKHKGSIVYAYVDDVDFLRVSGYTWWVKENNYVYTNSRGRKNRTSIYLHRLITDAEDGQEVDHVNHNPLDNRRQNLRLCTKSQNGVNRQKRGGVTRFKNMWRARIKKDQKELHLGIFKTKNEALSARLYAERSLFGNFARS
jgi:hypothetical protein